MYNWAKYLSGIHPSGHDALSQKTCTGYLKAKNNVMEEKWRQKVEEDKVEQVWGLSGLISSYWWCHSDRQWWASWDMSIISKGQQGECGWWMAVYTCVLSGMSVWEGIMSLKRHVSNLARHLWSYAVWFQVLWKLKLIIIHQPNASLSIPHSLPPFFHLSLLSSFIPALCKVTLYIH